MSKLAIAALVPKQTGWMDERIVVVISDGLNPFIPVFQEWMALVTDMATHTSALVGSTFRSYEIWPELFRVPEGTHGMPVDSNWGKVTKEHGLSALHHQDCNWVVTPSTVIGYFNVPGFPTFHMPVLTAATLYELSSNPLEMLADVGLTGPITGFPTTPGRYRVIADVNGVLYEKTVEVVPDEMYAGRLEVQFDDGVKFPLDRLVSNAQWLALS